MILGSYVNSVRSFKKSWLLIFENFWSWNSKNLRKSWIFSDFLRNSRFTFAFLTCYWSLKLVKTSRNELLLSITCLITIPKSFLKISSFWKKNLVFIFFDIFHLFALNYRILWDKSIFCHFQIASPRKCSGHFPRNSTGLMLTIVQPIGAVSAKLIGPFIQTSPLKIAEIVP